MSKRKMKNKIKHKSTYDKSPSILLSIALVGLLILIVVAGSVYFIG